MYTRGISISTFPLLLDSFQQTKTATGAWVTLREAEEAKWRADTEEHPQASELGSSLLAEELSLRINLGMTQISSCPRDFSMLPIKTQKHIELEIKLAHVSH